MLTTGVLLLVIGVLSLIYLRVCISGFFAGQPSCLEFFVWMFSVLLLFMFWVLALMPFCFVIVKEIKAQERKSENAPASCVWRRGTMTTLS